MGIVPNTILPFPSSYNWDLSSEDVQWRPLGDVFPNSYIPLLPFDKVPLHKTLEACLDVGGLWSKMLLDRIDR